MTKHDRVCSSKLNLMSLCYLLWAEGVPYTSPLCRVNGKMISCFELQLTSSSDIGQKPAIRVYLDSVLRWKAMFLLNNL